MGGSPNYALPAELFQDPFDLPALVERADQWMRWRSSNSPPGTSTGTSAPTPRVGSFEHLAPRSTRSPPMVAIAGEPWGPPTRRARRRVTERADPRGLPGETGFGSVWESTGRRLVHRIDPETGTCWRRSTSARLRSSSSRPTAAWSSAPPTPTQLIDPVTNTITATLPKTESAPPPTGRGRSTVRCGSATARGSTATTRRPCSRSRRRPRLRLRQRPRHRRPRDRVELQRGRRASPERRLLRSSIQ